MKIQMAHVMCVCTQVCLTALCIPSPLVTAKATLLRAGGLTGGHLTTIDVNLPVFTTWLHDAEFKEPTEHIEENEKYTWLSDERFWEELLLDVLKAAQWCSNEEELNEDLDWALKGGNKNAD